MDSETSENTDTISADLITNVFSSLSTPKPPNLSRSEFNIFHFYSSLISGTRQMLPLSTLIKVIYLFQCFTVTSVFMLYDEIEENGNNISKTFQFLYFFLNFNLYSEGSELNSSYLLGIALVGFICIIMFFFSFYLSYKIIYIHIGGQCLFVFFLIDLPQIFIIVYANVSSRLVCMFLSQVSMVFIFQTIFLTIFTIILYIMVEISTSTLHNSVYYQNGSQIKAPSLISNHGLYVILIILVNIMRSTLNSFRTKIFMASFYGLLGVYLLWNAFLRVNQLEIFNALTYGFSFTLFSSTFYYAFRAAGYNLAHELFLFINFWILFGVTIIARIVSNSVNKSIVKTIMSDDHFFSTKEKFSDYKLNHYAKVAFMEALPCAIDLTFLDQSLDFDRPSWLLYQMLRYAILIDSNGLKTKQLVAKIEMVPSTSMDERYTRFEMDSYQYANITGEPPENLKNSISELESKIGQFQIANKSFTAKISDDNVVNSLLIDALSSMKYLISNEVRFMRAMLPNCPTIIQLYATYKSKVCDNEKSAKNWNTIAGELKKGSVIFADFAHIHAYDIFPKMQASLLKILTKNRSRLPAVGRQFTVSPYAQKLPPITHTRFDSRQTLSAIFTNRLSLYSIFSTVSFFLLLLAIFIHLLQSFSQVNVSRRNYNDFFDLSSKFLSTAGAYSSFIVSVLGLIKDPLLQTAETIALANERTAAFQAVSNELSSIYRMKSFSKDSIFKESFSWFPKKIFEIPTIDINYTMEEEYTVTLSRLSTLFLSLMKGQTINRNAPEMPAFLVTAVKFPEYFIQALELTSRSVLTLLDKVTAQVYRQLLYFSIPYFIAVALCCTIPLFIQYELKQLIPLFPHDQSLRSQSLLDTFLSRDFTTFGRSFAKFYFFLLIHVVIGLAAVFSMKELTSTHNENMTDDLTSLVGIGYQYIYGSAIISYLYLDSIENISIELDHQYLYDNVQQAINFFCNGTNNGHLMISSHDSNYITKFVIMAIHQVCKNEIIINELELISMRQYFEVNILNDLYLMTKTYIETMMSETDNLLVKSSNVTQVLVWLALIVFLFEIILFMRMWRNLNVLVQMLTQLPEKFISSSEKLLELLQERTQLSQFSEFKRSSVLDLLNLPCALVDSENFIIITNRAWLSFFNDSSDNVIGRALSDFLKVADIKYMEKSVNRDQKLVIVEEKKREQECKKRLKVLKERVINMRSVLIPERFVRLKESTEFEVAFIVNCCVIMSPTKTEDLNPDEWISDIKEFEQWISERCKICDDVDILRGSGRELMLLFGVNEKCEPHLLALSAFTIIIDSMRWGLEYQWRSGGINVCTTISCGNDSKFSIKKEIPTKISMFGEAFDKQMALKEKIELNSIVCDKKVVDIITSCKVGASFDQIDAESFIFSIEVIHENMNIRSGTSY